MMCWICQKSKCPADDFDYGKILEIFNDMRKYDEEQKLD